MVRTSNRRAFLATGLATVGGVALAGCLGGRSDGGGGGDGGDGSTTGEGMDDGTGGAADSGGGDADGGGTGGTDATATTTTEESGFSHPAAKGIADQPYRGPPPGEASGTIVAFEDPSCPRCRAFEQQVLPKVYGNLTETGKATYVFRGYPVVYDWGEPATKALEATYARDEAAHWDLVSYYFGRQSSFTADNVLAKTESFLNSDTDVDAAAVISAVEDGEADAAVQTDLDAGKAAGAGRTTPSVFLFKDGEYRTKAAGSVSYSIIESVLGASQ